jgi:predicted N-acyltransferase
LFALHSNIRGIDAASWDALAGDNAFATTAWLLTVEQSWLVKASPLYLIASEAGAVTATAVCYVVESSPPYETLDDLAFGRLRASAGRLGASFLPAMMCGPATGYGWHVGVAAGANIEDARRATTTMVEALEREADARGLSLHFAHVLDHEDALTSVLGARRYLRSRGVPVAMIDLRWPTFDAYLAGFPTKTRAELRRQIRRNQEGGTCLERLARAGPDEGSLMQLLIANAQKHRGPAFPFGPGFLDRLCDSMGDGAWVVAARKRGRLSGVCVTLSQNRAAHTIGVGVDRTVASDDYTYFQMVYYDTIARAIESDLDRVYFGRGAYEAKIRRGCSIADTWMYSRLTRFPSRAGAATWYSLTSRWNRYKLPAIARRANSR